jgi:hypothetical protein
VGVDNDNDNNDDNVDDDDDDDDDVSELFSEEISSLFKFGKRDILNPDF